MLSRPMSAPLTKSMERLGSHIVKTKLKQSEDGRSLVFKTGGQPLTAVYITKPRLPSSSVSATTLRNRSKLLETTRGFVSKGESSNQLNDEIKQHKDLQSSLSNLHQQRVLIPTGEFLGLKADLCSSWKKNRELKRYKKGLIVESELLICDMSSHLHVSYLPYQSRQGAH
ncbi:hypothetical protein HOLleu_10742 [Holothuria leucospilota]|uniref:Uncharacterized protein n=1 Tax=Holothuria leucospilota TaxID=206669 RepID=A0A9Q1CFJ8_HOLLE|nr:hypothetical protein HOLleu_10742 [Holothuria leucospilota]